MAILKCKMCGGDITVNEDKTVGVCDYCGSTMTLPKVSDDQRAARFNRGNHFRRQGEFDKALAVYETIVNEDETDAEAHWCCALCRFGIEYVEDPNTYEYIPTCHRASFDSFLDDVDYKAALQNSDGITRRQYQKDAAKIAEVQRGILATSQNEAPFDVFICYKETDDQTKERTRDSLDAQEIYYQLTQEGYRVFFARLTLEDKAGTEYEPYIFAALNSAKVMIALGSKPEYLNAVWVKNEWSRFLAMMRKDRSKLLLPCYKGMDPYDLPEQLGVLQSYDMSKIGFMQDLIRGVRKVVAKDEPAAPQSKEAAAQPSGPSASNLIRRGQIFLEEKNWDSAAEYFNKALDIDAEDANAYLGLAFVKLQCSDKAAFAKKFVNEETLPDISGDLRRVKQFGSTELLSWLEEQHSKRTAVIEEREIILAKRLAAQEAAINEKKYVEACAYQETNGESSLLAAYEKFKALSNYKDSAERAALCKRLSNELREQRIAREAQKRAEREAVIKAQKDRMALARNRIARYQGLISAGVNHTVGVKSDGTVLSTELICQSRYDLGQTRVNKWQNIVQVSANAYSTLGLQSDGSVVATMITNPDKDFSQCDVSSWRDIVQISAGIYYSVGLRRNGTVIAVGADNFGRCNVKDWKSIVRIAATTNHTAAVKADGTAIAVGSNEYGQCNVTGKNWADLVDIAVNDYHTVGLKADGTVVAVGKRDDRMCDVSYWRDIVAISAGSACTVGLKADGTVVATGSNKDGVCDVSSWKNIIAISAGAFSTIGLREDGTLVAVGNKYSGRCNVGGWKLFKSDAEKEIDYTEACRLQASGEVKTLHKAAKIFVSLKDYKDSAERASFCAVTALNAEKTELSEELPQLKGLFAGTRRKKIEERLEEIENELKTCNRADKKISHKLINYGGNRDV